MRRFTSCSNRRREAQFARGDRGVGTPLVLAFACMLPLTVNAAVVANPLCPAETALYDPGNGQDISVPSGYVVSVFAAGLNFPTGIAFRATNGVNFEVYVLESGHGLPAGNNCNDEAVFQQRFPGQANPFTPDIKVFSRNGRLLRTLGKPTHATTATGGNNVLQPHGPAVDIAFENGLQGGRLFGSDSNQATHAHNGQNNSSRIVIIDPQSGAVTPFISNLPTGDHPTEEFAFNGGWIYWSQGSTTNSGVVGLDNGGGQNQPDIPCQDIVLSQNVFDSGNGKKTSGYSPFGVAQPGATVKAFTGAAYKGVCDGAILRAPSSRTRGATATGSRCASPRRIMCSRALSWSERTVPTSAVRGLRTEPRTRCILPVRTTTAHRTITAGPIGTASSRATSTCSTRSAGRATICASSTPPIRRVTARRRAWR